MALPGMYLRVTDGKSVNLLVPYNEKFGFKCNQKWYQPLKELYDYVKNLTTNVIENAGAGILTDLASGTKRTIETASRIFGYQLFAQGFTAKAWEGSEPINLDLTLNFYFGMDDKFSGKEEVYDKIMNTMGYTVPTLLTGSILKSPGPTGVDVFLDYSKDLFKIIDSTFTKDASNAASKSNTTLSNNKTWTVELGYYSGSGGNIKSIFQLSDMVVTSSGFNFSTELDSHGYPIEGQLNLSMTSQTVIVSSDFLSAPSRRTDTTPVV